MNKSRTRLLLPIIGGILLILAGVIFLLDNLDVIMLDWELLIGPMFGLGGLVFLLVFIMDTDEWWALIPGFVLIGIGINTFMGQYLERVSDRWGGAVFLGFIALAFIVIYVSHYDHWWAIIPGGVLMTLAGVTLLPDNHVLSGGVFFLGMALTFGLVYILPKPSGKLTWALYPAGILFLIGIAVTLGATDLLNYIWPLALLVAGIFVLYQALRNK
jgi:hypothetical protein